MVILTKYNLDADKHVQVVNLPPMRLIDGTRRQGRTCSIQGSWYTEILLAVTTTVVVPVEEALADIVMKFRKVVIYIDCGVEASWVI